MPEKYSNESLYIMLKGIRDDIIDIKSQVRKTNGRVRSLEIYRSFLVGAISVLSFFFIYFLSKFL